MVGAATSRSLLDKVKSIRPILQEHAAHAERERRLAKPTIHAMVEAGLFRMWIPEAFGGFELDPMSAMRVVEEVSRADSAAGWNLQIAISVTLFLTWFPNEGVHEVLTDKPGVILGGTLFPPGHALPVKGGYLLTGRWPFVSGCHECAWFVGPAFVQNGGDLRRGEDGEPIQLLMLYRAEESQILDTWHTVGMRGTGSHDIAVRDVFVPLRRTGLLTPLSTFGRPFEGPLYRLTIWPAVAALAAPALGIARSAIDALYDLGKQKTPNYARSTLRERPVVQMQVAEAEALLGAARAYLYDSLRDGWNTAIEGRTLGMKQKINIQLATSYAIRAAAEAVDLVCRAAGTTAIRQEHPFQQYFRDVHVITQHAFGSANRFESAGKLLFGLDSDWGFFSL
jgi:alkylation response protein AidB-like acyl-CoA dehydrogenase